MAVAEQTKTQKSVNLDAEKLPNGGFWTDESS